MRASIGFGKEKSQYPLTREPGRFGSSSLKGGPQMSSSSFTTSVEMQNPGTGSRDME